MPIWDDRPISVAAAGTGFVVAYILNGTGAPAQIRGQRYTATGVKVGLDFQINTTNPGHIYSPRVTRLADGGFLVVWEGGPNAANSGEIYARRYNANGAPVTGQFIVNTTLVRTQTAPSAAALANGGFVVVWSTLTNTGGNIVGQRYNANGVKAGGEIAITTTAGSENTPEVTGLTNGGFVVAWNDDALGVAGRRFTAAGAANGATFVVGSPNYGHWETIALTALDDARFLVAYAKSGDNIYAKVLGPTAAGDGSATEFRVNTSTTAGQRLYPAAVGLSNRNLFVAWWFGTVRLRRLDLPAAP
jgi:hypothetical protein